MGKKLTLITGAGSQTSRLVLGEIKKRGWRKICTDIKPYNKKVLGLYLKGRDYIRADLTKKEELKQLKNYEFDYVIHTAAIVSPFANPMKDRLIHYHVNRDGTRNLFETLEDCLNSRGRIINTSTASLYKPPIPETGAKETDPIFYENESAGAWPWPFKAYTESKWGQEEVGRKFFEEKGMPVITTRVGGLMSEYSVELIGDLINIVTLDMGSMIHNMLPGSDKFMMGLVSAKNVASAEVYLLEKAPIKTEFEGNIYNIADEEPLSLGEIVDIVAENTGALNLRLLPEWIKKKEMRVLKKALSPDLGKVMDALGVGGKGPIMSILKSFMPAMKSGFDMKKVYKLIEAVFDGLKFPELPGPEFINDFLKGHYCFDITKLKSLGWKPERNSREELPDIVQGMLRNGIIPNQRRLMELFYRGYADLLATKYHMPENKWVGEEKPKKKQEEIDVEEDLL